LTFHDFSVDTFDTKSSVNASVEMFFNNLSSDSFTSSDRAIVRTLRTRVVVTLWETEHVVGFHVPEAVFLFPAEPEISVIFFLRDLSSIVGGMRSSVRVQDFAHDEVSILSLWISAAVDWFELEV
jgi:hypothetical protein